MLLGLLIKKNDWHKMKAKTQEDLRHLVVLISKMSSGQRKNIIGDNLGYSTTYYSPQKSSTSKGTQVIGDNLGYGSTYSSQ